MASATYKTPFRGVMMIEAEKILRRGMVRSNVYDFISNGDGDGLRAAGRIELLKYVFQMELYRVPADTENGGHFPGVFPFLKPKQYFLFSGRQGCGPCPLLFIAGGLVECPKEAGRDMVENDSLTMGFSCLDAEMKKGGDFLRFSAFIHKPQNFAVPGGQVMLR